MAKTPTSSLTAGELLVNQLWYRSKAKIKRLVTGGTPGASAASSSSIAKLPQEVVNGIISHCIHDKGTLLACSTTCYSWYIAAVPHLHHSLTTDDDHHYPEDRNHPWPLPLQKSHKLGLLPFVKRFRIRMGVSISDTGFAPERLSKHNLSYFSALTNLQELGIDYLQVSSFMPTIQQCFGHFSPTLQFLALKQPKGTCREILYFIGLFPNLQDLKLHYPFPMHEEEIEDGLTPAPLSIPPLRGRLMLTCFRREDLVKNMIDLFGGLHFRHMDLFRVQCVRLLLDACTETLETLRLYPTDPYADNSALLRDFNLSRSKSLRTLETTAESIDAAGDLASNFLKTVLSSITPPIPLDVVVIYREIDLSSMPHCSRCDSDPVRDRHPSPWGRIADAVRFRHQFGVFREMHSVRDFRLVFCADVFDCMVEEGVETLERMVKEGHLSHEPLIISERRTLRTRYTDQSAGWSGGRAISASAL